MTKAKKEKLPVFISPKGVAAYAWLNKKDTLSEKYKVSVVLDKKEMGEGRLNYGKDVVTGKVFIKTLLDLAASIGAPSKINEKGCHIKDGDKHKNEDFRGKLLIEAKSGFKPKLVDTKGNPLPKDETIWSGDIIKLAFQPKHSVVSGNNHMPYYISQVMLIEKGERKGGGSLDFGEEEGYVADDSDVDFGEDAGDSTDDDNEDF
jgi:hypothetical protein